jgi:hypothetical protein
LPQGFYDDPKTDFKKWIEDDVDPTEIRERAEYAAQWVTNTDPNVRQALRDYYGLTDDLLTAYALDRTRGLDLIKKQANAAVIGGAGSRYGFNVSRDRAEQYADLGRAQVADSAFSAISEILPDATRLSSIYDGEDVTSDTLMDEALGGLASAKRARKRLVSLEESSFGGKSGVGQQSLGKRSKGSY